MTASWIIGSGESRLSRNASRIRAGVATAVLRVHRHRQTERGTRATSAACHIKKSGPGS